MGICFSVFRTVKVRAGDGYGGEDREMRGTLISR